MLKNLNRIYWKYFFKGFCSIFNIFGFFEKPKIKSDYEAIKDDWEKVRKDLNFLKVKGKNPWHHY